MKNIKNKGATKTASAYGRFNPNSQSTESIEEQREAITEFAKANNIDIVEWYIDCASGISTDRNEFLRMINEAKSKNISHILVYRFDRFSCNMGEYYFYKFELKKIGVSILSVTEPQGESPAGKMMESIFSCMAEYYCTNCEKREEVANG
ncbi:MAG: recombinase family protein [Firmicutes bacterium]|nr:recombinase family protein [Bacillota bacterium]